MRHNIIPLFNRYFLPLVFLTGLVLRLVIAPMGGHPGDIHTITRWAAALNGQSLLSVYQISDANYPPLAMAMLGAMAWVYHLLTGGAAEVNDLWLILMKLPPILSDLGIGWAVWKTTAQSDHGEANPANDDWFFQRCVLLTLVVFNPALVYLSAYWGQYESVYMVFTLLAVLLAVRGKPLWAGAAISAGLMVKLQAAVAGPVVVLAILAATQTGGLSRSPLLQRLKNLALAALGGLLVLLVFMGPYVIDGQGEYVYKRLIAVAAGEGWITVNALNGWYLATGGTVNYHYGHHLDVPDTDPFLWGLSARSIGTVLTAIWTVMVVVLAWRARGKARGWLLAATLLYLGVFLFPTQVKERYSYGAVVMLAGAVAVWLGEGRRTQHVAPLHRQQTFWLYIVFSALHTLNLLWAAPVLGLDEWFAGNSIYGLIVAAGMVVSTGWGLWLLIKVGWDDSTPHHDGALPDE